MSQDMNDSERTTLRIYSIEEQMFIHYLRRASCGEPVEDLLFEIYANAEHTTSEKLDED